ncbi:hypothetical protein ACSBPU_21085 [Parapusillimonas sp. JC17]|uniref:hypothetical protein n=1 Tax=Parapusillimonas sp. JC17 TaxID=3445768 RepID=UPI003FA0C877
MHTSQNFQNFAVPMSHRAHVPTPPDPPNDIPETPPEAPPIEEPEQDIELPPRETPDEIRMPDPPPGKRVD